MREGAFMMIDALGFRGIWNRAQAERVLAKLRAISMNLPEALKKAEQSLKEVLPGHQPVRIECALLSDTVVVAVVHDQPAESITAMDRFRSIVTAAAIAANLTPLSTLDPPWTYRGCISYGQFEVFEQFIVGPAVDDAASLADIAEAAVIWLTPTAQAVLGHYAAQAGDEATRGAALLTYPVPLKSGGVYRTRVVHPFMFVDADKRMSQRDALLATFTPATLPIEIKKQNTAAFFDVALSHSDEG